MKVIKGDTQVLGENKTEKGKVKKKGNLGSGCKVRTKEQLKEIKLKKKKNIKLIQLYFRMG